MIREGVVSHSFNPQYQDGIDKHYAKVDHETEKELVVKAKSGDVQARRALINSQLKSLTKLADRYANAKSSKEDLVGEGTLGIYKAIDLFDLSKDLRFITYAMIWAKFYILAYVHDDDTIRHPSNINKRIKQQQAELLNGEEPEKKLRIPMRSLDAPQGAKDDSETLSERISDDSDNNIGITVENKVTVEKLIKRLNPKQSYIVRLLFGLPYVDKVTGETVQEDPMSMEMVGERIGESKQNVSNAFKKIREVLTRKVMEKRIGVPKVRLLNKAEADDVAMLAGIESGMV